MELLILTAIGMTGYFINKSKKKPERKPLKQSDRSPIILVPRKKSTKVNEDDLTEQFFSEESNDKEDDYNLLDISEKITDNGESIQRILNDPVRIRHRSYSSDNMAIDGPTRRYSRSASDTECSTDNISERRLDRKKKYQSTKSKFHFSNTDQPQYSSQFQAPSFDAVGTPSAPNDTYATDDKARLADLERQISYQGGWTEFDPQNSMSYGVVPDELLTHNNMVPFYTEKSGYGSNDLRSEHASDLKNDLFTGKMATSWKKKEEIRPLFSPQPENIYGTPIQTEEEKSRYTASRYRQNEKPFESTQVTPGLNLGYYEVGKHGFHDPVRVLPKTVDELRVRPKVSLEGRIVEGMRGQKRPVQAPVISYRPPTFREMTEKDLLPKTDTNQAPKVKDNFILKETDRINQHIEYTGGAYTSDLSMGRNVPENIRGRYKCPNRQTFTLPKPLQKFAKEEAAYNPNIGSYDLPYNARAQLSANQYIGGANNLGSNIYSNLSDVSRTTLREITTNIPQQLPQVSANTMRGTVPPMDIANPTLREVTEENKLNPHAASLSTLQRVYHHDEIKTTMKETTNIPVSPCNVAQSNNIYANWTDTSRPTLKEVTSQVPYQTNLTPISHSQGQTPLQDVTRKTLKEITAQIPYPSTVQPRHQNPIHVHSHDTMRSTVKETTIQVPHQTFITPSNQFLGVASLQDTTRSTLKEVTDQIPRQLSITPLQYSPGTTAPQDIVRSTLKETTIQIPYSSSITPINKGSGATLGDDARTTLKEVTTQVPRQSCIDLTDQSQGPAPSQDIPRPTLKETTVQIPYQSTISLSDQSLKPMLQDIARPTLKESTLEIPYQTTISRSGQSFKPMFQDIARPTLKENTLEIPYQTVLKPINHGIGQSSIQDLPKATLKEITIEIPYRTMATPINQASGAATTFDRTPLRTTTKETTVTKPYQTSLVGPQQGKAFNNEPTKTTIRECTVEKPRQRSIQMIGQLQGSASTFDKTPLSTTLKEMVINNKYLSAPHLADNGYGYLSQKQEAPNTNRQFTEQEVYVPPIEGESKPRPYDDIYHARTNAWKEILVTSRAPTTCNVNLGPSKDQIHLQAKDDNHVSPEPRQGVSVNNCLDRLQPSSFLKIPITNVSSDHAIQSVLLGQLESNPYHIPLTY